MGLCVVSLKRGEVKMVRNGGLVNKYAKKGVNKRRRQATKKIDPNMEDGGFVPRKFTLDFAW